MAAHAHLKNEFTEDEKYHNLMSWLKWLKVFIWCFNDFSIYCNPESFPFFWLNTARLTSCSVILLPSFASGMIGISVIYISSESKFCQANHSWKLLYKLLPLCHYYFILIYWWMFRKKRKKKKNLRGWVFAMFCSLRPSFILKHFLAYSIIYYFGFDKSFSIFVSFIPNEFISGFFFLYFMFIFYNNPHQTIWRIWMFIRSLVYGNMLCKSSLTVSVKKLVTVSICVSMLVFWSVSKFSWCSLDKCCWKSSLFF